MITIKDIDISGKKLLIRVDLNVPLDENQNIIDDTRIRAVLPTINYALDEHAKVIVASHMGRPEGKVVPELSLAPVAKRLTRLLQKDVQFASDCIGPEVDAMIKQMQRGDVLLLENLRFHLGEQENDNAFAKKLASLCEVYVNDAFAVAHRENASVVAITQFAPVCVAGFLLKKEFNYFTQALKEPARPLVAIIGGAKVSSKLAALENLFHLVDKFLIGGAMANTFLKSVDYDVGESFVENDLLWEARSLMKKATQKGTGFYIPVDAVVADRFDADAETKITPIQEIPPEWLIMDIGPATSLLYSEVLASAKTIIWNGPMGVFEMDAFSRGTSAMVNYVANSYALTIVGGGSTDVAIHRAGESYRITYISTGGGAFLDLMEGKTLPAVAALDRAG
ncbi:MAG: phosphoglycerate kinase [Deltaproteobacteria bacterium]|nr:phosphoglycerate kinase [Deltaproteobacteria bacterium]MBW2339228.1 phosphoglycerate kinase [Deltaproteobacteria bacterium]